MNDTAHPENCGARLYFVNGVAVYLGTVGNTGIHRHHAIQIAIGLESEFKIQGAGEKTETRLAFTDSDTYHCFWGEERLCLFILAEPESLYGAAIRDSGYMQQEAGGITPDTLKQICDYISSGTFAPVETVRFLFDLLGIPSTPPLNRDPRIARIIGIIEEREDKKIRPGELAQIIHLSESRLQHLFRQEAGISIRQFLLWKKMIDGIRGIAEGRDFTRAAYDAGFADSSHMSRTFKSMFGITLSVLFKNSRNVQVFTEDP